MKTYTRDALLSAVDTLNAFIEDPEQISNLEQIISLLAAALKKKNKIIIFGNGGSMCDAMHFAEELSGRFKKNRPALPAIAISDPSHITCVANDFGFDEIFARGVEAYALPNDVVIGISTSGNSPNIIRGISKAQEMGCFTVGLLGGSGGKLKNNCDFEICAPASSSDRIQELHGTVIHIIIEGIERLLFPELYN